MQRRVSDVIIAMTLLHQQRKQQRWHTINLLLFSFLLSRSGPSLLPPLSSYLPLIDPCCHCNEIRDKMDYNSAFTRDIFKIFA